TRFSRDWSSDVCSSDLRFVNRPYNFLINGRPAKRRNRLRNKFRQLQRHQAKFLIELRARIVEFLDLLQQFIAKFQTADHQIITRSEERRVGKESKSA